MAITFLGDLSNFGLTLIVDHDDHDDQLVHDEKVTRMSMWNLDDDRRVDLGRIRGVQRSRQGMRMLIKLLGTLSYNLQGA